LIVLDTNVMSELMRIQPDRGVIAWLDELTPETVWTTSISVFEIRFGLAIMAEGNRRQALTSAFDAMLLQDLKQRILVFDNESAEKTALISAKARSTGRNVDLRDAMIAGTVASQQASLATRNTQYFEAAGIDLINPWNVADD